MIEFMVIAAPRSGTAWAANWLTTADSLCIHDPLWTMHYDQLDAYKSEKRVGISCTGIWRFTGWLNAHPAKKVIVHRPLREVNASLVAIGMPIERLGFPELHKINGLHVSFRDLFHDGGRIWKHLMPGLAYDEERYKALRKLKVHRDLAKIEVNQEASRRLLRELATGATA